MKKFEYRCFGCWDDDKETVLNKIGQEGWEVVYIDKDLISYRHDGYPSYIEIKKVELNITAKREIE